MSRDPESSLDQPMTTAGLQAKVTLRRTWFEAHPNQPMPEGRAEVERLFAAIEADAIRAADHSAGPDLACVVCLYVRREAEPAITIKEGQAVCEDHAGDIPMGETLAHAVYRLKREDPKSYDNMREQGK